MCDTFLALSAVTADGSVIFGKNSDREPNEAQALEYHPARTFSPPGNVKCTYRDVPQAKETFAILISRPFWMWGAEMGANEKGVVIGNEAVFTRMPLQRDKGLTGMDLIRLALERSATASRALETIVQLLADFGQGGICGYEDKRMAYHNSFIIADPREGWVLETAGQLWAAVKIDAFYAISNRLTIGEAFDQCHPQLIATARKKGWLKKGRPFHFARCYSDWFYTTFSAARRRCERSRRLLTAASGKIDVSAAAAILRDHDGQDYRPDSHFLGDRICAHAANKLARHATQTTASLIARLKVDQQTYFATGTAAPCTAIFKPVWLEPCGLPDIGPTPNGNYNPDSLWWFHEKLHRVVLLDHALRLKSYTAERDRLEKTWMMPMDNLPAHQRWELMAQGFRQARKKTAEWIERVRSLPLGHRQKWTYRRYWQCQNKRAGISI
jgi:dipeptidase